MADHGTTYSWNDLPREELKAGLSRHFVAGDGAMLAHIYFEKGVSVPKHSHENEQITWVVEGLLRLTLGDDEDQVVELGPGDVLHIPPHVPHSAVALEATVDVDVFTPPRSDWIDGSDAYLRR
jgi:quercetin dioxygenase-like cupin family protein